MDEKKTGGLKHNTDGIDNRSCLFLSFLSSTFSTIKIFFFFLTCFYDFVAAMYNDDIVYDLILNSP